MSGSYNISVRIQPRRLVTVDDAVAHVGGEAIFQAMRKAGWIKPAIERRKLTRFDMKNLEAAVDRLESENLPLD